MPNPGEIWRIQQKIPDLASGSAPLNHHLFSQPARRFFNGDGPIRHVMIVGDVYPLSAYSSMMDSALLAVDQTTAQLADYLAFDLLPQGWVTVMVLDSSQHLEEPNDDTLVTSGPKALSHADAWIPSCLSGLDHNVIAETWHIVPMLVNQLWYPTGNRLDFLIYNYLLDIGDPVLSTVNPLSHLSPPAFSQGLAQNGPHPPLFPLNIAPGPHPVSSPQVQSFHHVEKQWSEVLRLPITACYMQFEQLLQTTSMIDRACYLNHFNL
ncbi:MAG: hypothetical protein AAGD25_27460 [Cyanobacteria bacterium P01_F01_bin.150]